MKRLIPLLLLLALLCGCTRAPETIQVVPTAPVESPIQPPAQGPTQSPAEPQAPSQTAGGFRVYTDASQYTPFALPQPKYTRLSDGPLPDFRPGDYGAVLPYAGTPLFSANGGYASYPVGYNWGFCDDRGRILTDPTYVDVQPLCTEQDMMGQPLPGSSLPIWQVTRPYGVTRMVDEEYNYTYYEGKMVHGLVAMDGSFATEVKYVQIQPYRDCIVLREDWTTPDFTVIDLQGKPLVYGSRLLPPGTEWVNVDYGEGLLLLEYQVSGGEDVCRFYDLQGRQVLGPYRWAYPFSDGYACVRVEDGNYGFVDPTGNWLIPPDLQDAEPFREGIAPIEQDGVAMLIDTRGNPLVRHPGMSCYRDENGLYRFNDRDNYTQYFYDRSGRLVEGVSDVSGWWSSWGDGLLRLSEDDGLRLVDTETGFRSDLIAGMEYAWRSCAIVDGTWTRGYLTSAWREEGSLEAFLPAGATQTLPLAATAPTDPGCHCMAGELYDLKTGDRLWMGYFSGGTWVYHDDGTPALPGPVRGRQLLAVGGLVRVISDYACTYYDSRGSVVFCWPLDTAMAD